MYNCSDFLMDMRNGKSDCSRGSGGQSAVVFVYVTFWGICPRESDWEYWNANGTKGIVYSDRAVDLDQFKWSHVHPRQNTWRVMGDLSWENSYHVMDSIHILAVF